MGRRKAGPLLLDGRRSFKLFRRNRARRATAPQPSAACSQPVARVAAGGSMAKKRRYGLLLLLPTASDMIGSPPPCDGQPFSACSPLLCLRRGRPRPCVVRKTLRASTHSLARLIFFGFFLGIAVLARGRPQSILACGAVFLWTLTTTLARCFRLFHPVAIVSLLRHCPALVRSFARAALPTSSASSSSKTFQTADLPPKSQHIQPFWYTVPVLARYVLSVACDPREWRHKTARSTGLFRSTRLQLFFLTFPVFCIAFFSISRSKLPGSFFPPRRLLVCS